MLYHTVLHKSKNKSTKWLVFLAGYTGSCETWINLGQYLIEKANYSILLIDNLGAGKSIQPDGPYSTELMADNVLEVIQLINLNQFTLIGHSLGGAIAQQIAIKHSKLIEHLVLLSSFAKLDPVANLFLTGRYELLKSNADKRSIALSSISSLFGNQFLSDSDNIELAIQRMVNNPQTLPGMFGQLTACLEHNTRAYLRKIICKTSIITGANDILVHPRHSIELHEGIKYSSFSKISNSGHMIQLEQPKELAKVLINQIFV